MVEYTKVNVKLSNSQLKKLKDAVSNNTGTTLKINYWKELLTQLKMKQKNKKEGF